MYLKKKKKKKHLENELITQDSFKKKNLARSMARQGAFQRPEKPQASALVAELLLLLLLCLRKLEIYDTQKIC